MSNEREAAVTLKGNPITLIGPELKAGDKAPEFTCDQGLVPPISLSDMGNSVKVFNVVLSVDTPVCSAQTRRFNEEAANILGDLKIYTISADLPFAQKRFCVAEKTEAVETLSAFRNISQFSNDYGVAIEDSSLQGLTSRAVIILNESNEVIYSELVNEITEEPNYDEALSALR